MDEFESFLTAHIAKVVTAKKLDEKAESRQQLIDCIISNLLCECYPLVINYVETITE